MKKLNPWILVSLFVAAFTLSACGDDDDKSPKNDTVTVTEESLKGTWDGALEHDMAQGYYQRWRVQFDGKNYTSWHTHQTVGSTKDDEQGIKTVGDKEQGTWEYVDGALLLTPKKMWASYYFEMTSLQTGDGKYVYYNYNPDTMEADQWYETSEDHVKYMVEQDLKASSPEAYMYIKYWPVVSLTKSEVSFKINMDVFKLKKQ